MIVAYTGPFAPVLWDALSSPAEVADWIDAEVETAERRARARTLGVAGRAYLDRPLAAADEQVDVGADPTDLRVRRRAATEAFKELETKLAEMLVDVVHGVEP